MDFEEILKQWDEIQSSTKKKALIPRCKTSFTASKKHNATSPLNTSKPSSPLKQNKTLSSKDVLCAVSHKNKPVPPSASSKKNRSRPSMPTIREVQEEWLHKHITFDKDALADEEAKKKAERSVQYIKSMAPEARLDLHGYTQDGAWRRLSDFIDECTRRGIRKVLIIHGKGIHTVDREGVLMSVVRDYIERDSRCGASGHPDKKQGGSGATWVMLKY